MLSIIRSLIAEVLPRQPKPRSFRRRSLLDRTAQAPKPDNARETAAFGRRGHETAARGPKKGQ